MGDFRGKRAEISVYDDACELIVPDIQSMYHNLTIEQYERIIDELNSIPCMLFTLTTEQIKLLINDISKEK